VQPLRTLAIERETAQEDNARNRVGGLREASTREVVVDKALRAEAREQTLGDPLLEMQVNSILGEDARVLENDRTDWCFAAPVGEFLVRLAGCPEGVEGRGPTHVGPRPSVEWRKVPDWLARVVNCFHEWLGAEEFEGARQRPAEWRRLESSPCAGGLEQASTALDLRLQVFLAFTSRLELFVGDALLLCVEILPLDLAR
jgi:hypothetical protein